MKRLDRYKKYKSLQDLIHYRLENQSDEIAEHFRDLEDEFPIEITHESRLVSRWVKTKLTQRSDKENRVESIISITPIYGFNYSHLQELITRIESIILRAESMGEFTTCPESPYFDDYKIGKILISTKFIPVQIPIRRELEWENIKKELIDGFGSYPPPTYTKISVIKLYFTQL